MAFIRSKMVGDNGPYYYLVESVREGDKVKQNHLRYLGTDRAYAEDQLGRYKAGTPLAEIATEIEQPKSRAKKTEIVTNIGPGLDVIKTDEPLPIEPTPVVPTEPAPVSDGSKEIYTEDMYFDDYWNANKMYFTDMAVKKHTMDTKRELREAQEREEQILRDNKEAYEGELERVRWQISSAKRFKRDGPGNVDQIAIGLAEKSYREKKKSEPLFNDPSTDTQGAVPTTEPPTPSPTPSPTAPKRSRQYIYDTKDIENYEPWIGHKGKQYIVHITDGEVYEAFTYYPKDGESPKDEIKKLEERRKEFDYYNQFQYLLVIADSRKQAKRRATDYLRTGHKTPEEKAKIRVKDPTYERINKEKPSEIAEVNFLARHVHFDFSGSSSNHRTRETKIYNVRPMTNAEMLSVMGKGEKEYRRYWNLTPENEPIVGVAQYGFKDGSSEVIDGKEVFSDSHRWVLVARQTKNQSEYIKRDNQWVSIKSLTDEEALKMATEPHPARSEPVKDAKGVSEGDLISYSFGDTGLEFSDRVYRVDDDGYVVGKIKNEGMAYHSNKGKWGEYIDHKIEKKYITKVNGVPIEKKSDA